MMQKMRKWIVALLVVSLLGSSLGVVSAAPESSGTQDGSGDWTYNADTEYGKDTYYYYMEEHPNATHPKHELKVDVSAFQFEAFEKNSKKAEKDLTYLTFDAASVAKNDKGVYVYQGVDANGAQISYDLDVGEYVDFTATSLVKKADGTVDYLNIGATGEQVAFTVNVPETGLYAVEMDYAPITAKNGQDINAQFLFSFRVDGEIPFIESNSCVLSRVYKNEEIQQDEFGDDLRPKSEQQSKRRQQFLFDQTGVYGTLYYYLEAGEHTISVAFDGTPLHLYGVTLKQEAELLSYQDYLTQKKNAGAQEKSGVLQLFQAEDYYEQASAQLWPDADKSSSLTQPFSYNNIKINFGGGGQWKTPGHWITWEIEAPEDGLYNLAVKYRQNYLDGLFSSRKVYIDGQVPFKELNAVRFNYTSGWANKVLGDENGAFSIYLTKGVHTITMENVIGDLTSTMSVLQTVIADLNQQYLSVVMVTSADPDPYRDYYLKKQLPNLPDEFRKNADLLFTEAKRLEEIVGAKGAENAYFEDVAYNLQSYAEDIEELTTKGKLTKLKNDINGLSAKLSLYQEQALDIDYFAVFTADQKLPKTSMNVWEWTVYQVKSFFASFSSNKAAKVDESKSIRVWVNTGIDQFEIIKTIITDQFSSQHDGIQVDLELAQGSLINALAAGTGPDVMLGVGSDTVVNLALRGAVVDLKQYPGFDALIDQYVDGAEVPFTLEGNVYGIPNTNGCSVMFVRTDIFENMGLSIPKTWDDMYDVAQVLQRYNMTLGSAPSFANLLYQKGGSYFEFDDKGTPTKVLFDEDVAIEALVQHAEFFTKYGFPVSYDFSNRFRTGEMPIGIADYSIYVTLKYTAPEISGLWEMYPMPGTPKVDSKGNPVLNEKGEQIIDCTQMDNSGNGIIMLDDCENKEAAWEFIKWWSEAETQTRYANMVEARMGISARYATANWKTLENIGWTQKELSILKTQFNNLKFIPIVPGNYYVTRGINNSTRGVIDRGENARELLTEWTIKINDEILRKRTEFKMYN